MGEENPTLCALPSTATRERIQRGSRLQHRAGREGDGLRLVQDRSGVQKGQQDAHFLKLGSVCVRAAVRGHRRVV